MQTPPKRPNLRRLAAAALLAGLLLGTIFTVDRVTRSAPPPKPRQLSAALADVRAGRVAAVQIRDEAHQATFTYRDGHHAVVQYPYTWGKDLTETLLAHHVTVGVQAIPKSNGVLSLILLQLLPVAAVIGFLMFFLRRQGIGGLGRFGKGRGTVAEVPVTNFADVAGADEAVAELKEAVEFLHHPERFERAGARTTRGFLLVGPPGTGKTLLARAVAGEAGVPFIPVSGSDFVEMFVGVGAKRVRDLFDQARKLGRAIVFVDEIDSIGRVRGPVVTNGGSQEQENTLNQLLAEMDGFSQHSGVLVLAATNRPDILDPALTRPGRFDRTVQVPAPDRAARARILALHAKSRPVAGDVDLTAVARRTPGLTGADLAQLVNEAALTAARRGATRISTGDFDAALATVMLGRARTSAVVSDRDRRITAWHEAGHAVAALLTDAADDPVTVTIIPRGPAGGVTWMSGNDHLFFTRAEAEAKLVVALSGRAGEERLLDGDFTQGAAGDLKDATDLATAMVTELGMSGLTLARRTADPVTDGPLAQAVQRQVDQMLRAALDGARSLLAAHSQLLEAVAAALLEEETLHLSDLKRLRELYP